MAESKNFSPIEMLQIRQLARKAAELGEDFLLNLIEAKFIVRNLAVQAVGSGLNIGGRRYTASELTHEVHVIGEVINHAQNILKEEDRDLASQVEQLIELRDLGSLSDSDSRISKIIKHDW